MHYLDGITGVYQTPRGYYVDDADVEEFDKSFPYMQIPLNRRADSADSGVSITM